MASNIFLNQLLRADVAIIRACKADTLGNLVYYKTARNFNPLMATAANTVIVEVDEIVEAGELSPEEIVTPHLFVDGIIIAQKDFDEGRCHRLRVINPNSRINCQTCCPRINRALVSLTLVLEFQRLWQNILKMKCLLSYRKWLVGVSDVRKRTTLTRI